MGKIGGGRLSELIMERALDVGGEVTHGRLQNAGKGGKRLSFLR